MRCKLQKSPTCTQGHRWLPVSEVLRYCTCFTITKWAWFFLFFSFIFPWMDKDKEKKEPVQFLDSCVAAEDLISKPVIIFGYNSLHHSDFRLTTSLWMQPFWRILASNLFQVWWGQDSVQASQVCAHRAGKTFSQWAWLCSWSSCWKRKGPWSWEHNEWRAVLDNSATP